MPKRKGPDPLAGITPRGRPRTNWTKEVIQKLCASIEKWSKTKKAIAMVQWLPTVDMSYGERDTLLQMSDDFTRYYGQAKMRISANLLESTGKKDGVHHTMSSRYISMHDKDLKQHEKELSDNERNELLGQVTSLFGGVKELRKALTKQSKLDNE